MLVRLAHLLRRHPAAVVATWVLGALAVWIPAPRLPALLKDDAHGFLPPDMASQRAFAALLDEFPDAAPASRVALIAARDGELSDDDRRLLGDVATRLAARSTELGWRVRAVALAPHLGSILQSKDRRAELIAVDLPAPMLTQHTVARVRSVQAILRDAQAERPPAPGLQIELTGDAALGELLDAHARRDIDRTTWWVFGGVIAILLWIYRSPVAMLVPLLTIALSLMLSLGLVGWGASKGLPVNGVVEMFTIVIVVGCGVDYCLFLFARFREEMSAGEVRVGTARPSSIGEAVQRALSAAGKPILASAATNVIGLAVLILGRNRDLSVSGPTIAFSLVVATLAVLTLTPSLMLLVGRRLFWPIPAERAAPDGAVWRWVGRTAAARPRMVVAIVLALLAPAAMYGARVEPLYDSLAEYPADSSFVRGAKLYYERFHGAIEVSEPTLIVRTDRSLKAPEARAALTEGLDASAASLRSVVPLAYVRDLADPLGAKRSPAPFPPRESGDDSQVSPLPPRERGRGEGSWADRLAQIFAGDFYLGRSGTTTRIDLAFRLPPRSTVAMDQLETVRSTVESIVRDRLSAQLGPTRVDVLVAGETATYADIRALQRRDFAVIAVVATALILCILLVLVRSLSEALMLVAATLVAYLATYGATALIFERFFDLPGLSYQVQFLLFIVMLSLGQDYNIFVVSRVREEMRVRPLRSAIAFAVQHTGQVVSGCGLIMAAAFASLLAGSMTVLKEFAVALSLGILADTFVIRPLLVPSMLLLLNRSRLRSRRRIAFSERTSAPATAPAIPEAAAAS